MRDQLEVLSALINPRPSTRCSGPTKRSCSPPTIPSTAGVPGRRLRTRQEQRAESCVRSTTGNRWPRNGPAGLWPCFFKRRSRLRSRSGCRSTVSDLSPTAGDNLGPAAVSGVIMRVGCDTHHCGLRDMACRPTTLRRVRRLSRPDLRPAGPDTAAAVLVSRAVLPQRPGGRAVRGCRAATRPPSSPVAYRCRSTFDDEVGLSALVPGRRPGHLARSAHPARATTAAERRTAMGPVLPRATSPQQMAALRATSSDQRLPATPSQLRSRPRRGRARSPCARNRAGDPQRSAAGVLHPRRHPRSWIHRHRPLRGAVHPPGQLYRSQFRFRSAGYVTWSGTRWPPCCDRCTAPGAVDPFRTCAALPWNSARSSRPTGRTVDTSRRAPGRSTCTGS